MILHSISFNAPPVICLVNKDVHVADVVLGDHEAQIYVGFRVPEKY